MAFPIAAALLLGGGALVNILGQKDENEQRADAARRNGDYIEEQKRLTLLQNRREASLFRQQSASFIGDQVSAFAKAGVDLSGSALAVVSASKAAADREYNSILEIGKAKQSLFDNRVAAERAQQHLFDDPSYNNMQTLGTLLNVGGKAYSLGAK